MKIRALEARSRLKRRHFVASVAACGLAACLVSSCTAYSFQTATAPAGLSMELILTKINQVRRANRRQPLVYNAKLEQAARRQASLMATRDELSHNLGETLRERVRAAGYIGAVGENVAGGHPTLEAAIEGWLASPAHNRTLLSDKFTEFGLAVQHVPGGKKSRYGIYWALIMGGDSNAWFAT